MNPLGSNKNLLLIYKHLNPLGSNISEFRVKKNGFYPNFKNHIFVKKEVVNIINRICFLTSIIISFFYLFLLAFLSNPINSKSQDETITSVNSYNETLADSCKKFANICEFEKALHCGSEALKLSKQYLPTAKGNIKIALLKSQVKVLKNLGVTYYNLLDFPPCH